MEARSRTPALGWRDTDRRTVETMNTRRGTGRRGHVRVCCGSTTRGDTDLVRERWETVPDKATNHGAVGVAGAVLRASG